MTQSTIFSDKFVQSIKERQTKAQINGKPSLTIWKITSKDNHWKIRILSQINKNVLEKFKIQIESISEKQITFNLPHPALLERAKTIESLLIENIKAVLKEKCPCGGSCKSKSQTDLKLVFFVKYNNTPFNQIHQDWGRGQKHLPPTINTSEVKKISKTNLNAILEKYSKKIA